MAGYVGNIPVPQATQTRQSFTAIASQTSFPTIGYTEGFFDCHLNGVKLLAGVDFNVGGGNGSDVILATGAALNDILEVTIFDTFNTSSGTFSSTTLKNNVTLKNDTEQDTDGGRASKIIYQGEQSGGEISTLAEIEASHDGTADDEKGDLIFRTNDGSDGTSPTTAMTIDSAQNIIIGDASKGGSLGQVRIINDASSSPASLALFGHNNVSDGADFAKIQLAMQTGGVGGNVVAQITGEAEGTGENAAHLTFETATGGTLSEAMRITNDAKVGIGIDAPLRQLHINNTSANSEIAFTAATNGVSSLLFGDGQTGTDIYRGYIQYNHANDSLLLATSSTTRFTLNASGNLAVQGVYNDTGSDSPNVVVDGSGNIYRSTSALKYKKDVRDIESIDIDRFRPIRYKSAITKDDDTKDCLGFIADEVHDDGLTELVTYGVNPETEETEVEGFRYDRMTVILTKVVQEQKATIEAQATQIADLITRVTALEAE